MRDGMSDHWAADPDAIVEKVQRDYHALAAMERQAG
jgi:hypothetical protein